MSAGNPAESDSYETTTTDEFGNHEPAIAVELHRVDGSGTVIKSDPVGYAFSWDGIFAVIGLVISGLLAFVLAAPLGVLIGRLFNPKPNVAMNLEPK